MQFSCRDLVRFSIFGLGILFGSAPAIGQITSDQIIERALPSVALVLVGKSPAEVDRIGSAIVARGNGVLLTAFHVVKDAAAVQVRFKNGEVFDDVQLLGVDRRRDVAAIRINASGLPVLPVASAAQAKPGEVISLISHAAALPWTASAGNLSAYRMADEVPGAGSGYRLFQFTAPASPGSSGGVLIDSQGRALGLMVATLEGGQSLNFAIPVESVLGLADAPMALSFGSGSQLELRVAQPNVNPPVASVPAEQARVTNPRVPESPSEDLAKSELVRSKDKNFILSNFRTMCVDARDAKFFGADQMKAALGRNADFVALNIMIVDDRSQADVILEVGYTFAWDYPFSLKHQNTSIVLVSGKGSGPFSGPAGAASVARELAKLLKPYRTSKQAKPEPAGKKTPIK
jgi:hypothetical protein